MALLVEPLPDSFERGSWEELAEALEDEDCTEEASPEHARHLAAGAGGGSVSSSAYSLVGSWSSWGCFDELEKVTSNSGAVVYSATVPVRGGEIEEFQIAVRRSFQRLYYPESLVPGAKVLGPGSAGHGRNWRVYVPSDCNSCTFFWEPIARAVWWELGQQPEQQEEMEAQASEQAPPSLDVAAEEGTAEPSAVDAALLRAKAELVKRAHEQGPVTKPVAVTPEALRDAMCDLAVAYSDPGLQKLLQDIRQREDFLELLRELVLPRQAPVLERLGLPVSSEGLSVLESKVVRCIFKEKSVELQRMANGACNLLKLPPVSRRMEDPLFEASSGSSARARGTGEEPPRDPLDYVVEEGERRDFWRSLCPWLHVGDAALEELAKSQADPFADCADERGPDRRAAGWREELVSEGYFVVPGGASPWDASMAALERGIATLASLGLPPEFILAYDEPWVLAAQLEPLVRAVTGGAEVVFDWTVACAEAAQAKGDAGAVASADKGQSPGRGRGPGPETSGLDGLNPDGSPRYITFWISLTDSTPKNSCLMVVPRSRDAGYSVEEPEVSPICNVFREPEDFQHITALPVSAGSLVGLSNRLFCWDSVPDRGQAPRVALALGVADPAFKPSAFGEPTSVLPLPPLGVRLSLVAAHILRGSGSGWALSSVERLQLFSELFHRHKAPLSESLQSSVLAAATERYERLDYLESGPTFVEGSNGQPLPLFEAAAQRDPNTQPAAVSLPTELALESDPFEILAASGENKSFWQRLCPWLHVCDEAMGRLAKKAVFPCLRDKTSNEGALQLRDDLIRDGYFSVEGGLLPWAVDLSGMARGILELVGRGFPAVCILMYDEPWVLAAQLEELAWVATGGNELSFDWAAFCVRAQGCPEAGGLGDAEGEVAPVAARAGWPPHRDRGSNNAAARGFRADGSPKYTTFWVPLTDATPLSSCLHVVPRAGDPGYRAGDGRNSAIQNVFRRPEDFRRIRAVPLAAGGLLAFTHRIFHWGSAANHRAPAPRIAVAFPAVDRDFETPLFPDPQAMRPLPPLDIRLGLAAAQVLVYAANERHLTTSKRLERCWSIFHMHADAFHPSFVKGITETNTAQHQRLISSEQDLPSYVL